MLASPHEPQEQGSHTLRVTPPPLCVPACPKPLKSSSLPSLRALLQDSNKGADVVRSAHKSLHKAPHKQISVSELTLPSNMDPQRRIVILQAHTFEGKTMMMDQETGMPPCPP